MNRIGKPFDTMLFAQRPTVGLGMLVKWFFDVMVSCMILALLFPLIILVIIVIKIVSPGPIFFMQPRLGQFGTIFNMYKFRTMHVHKLYARELGVSRFDLRIIPGGTIIRNFHFDELAQLINVIKGEMSLIGPRATFPFHYDYYTEREKKRLLMRPGISGWSQVIGGNRIPWDERIKQDVWYVENWSLGLDVKIFFLTVYQILKQGFAIGQDSFRNDNVKVWTRGVPENPFTNSLMKAPEKEIGTDL